MNQAHGSADLYHIAAQRIAEQFPPVSEALREPDGLLAAGGDLSVSRLCCAYRKGIFPWFDQDEPILWWSPDPRTVFIPGEMHMSRSMRRFMRKMPFHFTYDRVFEDVMLACAAPRRGQSGTWISPEMIDAYCALHHAGFAHSIECWDGEELVGGLYGVAMGQNFYGESMFSRRSNASKACLLRLNRDLETWGYRLFDAQVYNEHLDSMGAISMPREDFLKRLNKGIDQSVSDEAWKTLDEV